MQILDLKKIFSFNITQMGIYVGSTLEGKLTYIFFSPLPHLSNINLQVLSKKVCKHDINQWYQLIILHKPGKFFLFSHEELPKLQ